jgi:hypothetical protein
LFARRLPCLYHVDCDLTLGRLDVVRVPLVVFVVVLNFVSVRTIKG